MRCFYHSALYARKLPPPRTRGEVRGGLRQLCNEVVLAAFVSLECAIRLTVGGALLLLITATVCLSVCLLAIHEPLEWIRI